MQHAAALSATVVAAGAGTADSFAVLEASLGPGAVIPNHVHRHEDVHLLALSGALSVVRDGCPQRVRTGEHVRLHAGQPWGARALDGSRLLVLFVPAGAERLAAPLLAAHDADDRAALLAAAGIHVVPATTEEP